MKIQKILSGILLTAMAVLAATQINAQVVTVTQIPGYGVGDGEFNVSPIIGSGYNPTVIVSNGFETFCLDRDTGITLGGTYFAFPDANGIYMPENLTLTKGTAYLYSQFAAGTLAGYDYTPG